MDSLKINQLVDKLYSKNTLMQKYGGEIFFSVLIIFIASVIFVYLQILNNLEPVKKNWATERCNPLILPLAGFINNPNKKTQTDGQYTIDNFEFCLGNIITSSFDFLLDSFKFILIGIQDMFQDILTILEGIIVWFMSIISWILGFLENIWGTTLQTVNSVQVLLNKIRDSFSRMIGMAVVTLYTHMMLFRMSIMWMITTPIFMIFTIVCGILVKILFFCIKNQLITTAKWASYMYCVIKTTLSDELITETVVDAETGTAETADGVADEGEGAGNITAGAVELPDPLTAAFGAGEMAEGTTTVLTGVSQNVDGVVQDTMSATSGAGNALTWGQTIAACGSYVTIIIWQALMMVLLMTQLTSLILTILIIVVLWEFNKSTLGAMNIRGQGIPGLSF